MKLSEEHSRVVGRILLAFLVFIIILSVFFAVRAINAIGGTDKSLVERPSITLQGEGEVFAIPDMAQFSFTVEVERDTVETAQKEVTEKGNEIITFLKGEDVAEKDIRTIGYNVYPRYDYVQEVCTQFGCPPGRQMFRGYTVSHSIEVRVRDTEAVGALLSGVGERGATNMSGIQFTIEDEGELKREAREMAIKDAKEQARALAKDLGVRLVRIIDFQESGYPYSPIPYYERAFEADGKGGGDMAVPEIPTGENRFTSNVTIVYEIR